MRGISLPLHRYACDMGPMKLRNERITQQSLTQVDRSWLGDPHIFLILTSQTTPGIRSLNNTANSTRAQFRLIL